MDNKQYISLLCEKREILNDILKYTKSKTFEKSEDEAERIEYYLNNRQKLFDKLIILDNKLKNIKFNDIDNMEVKSIIKENDVLIEDIIKLDEKNKKIIDSILNLLKVNIKSVKSMSKVNNSYLGTYQNVINGSLFDSSR
ncbi:MAG: hypothetical protein KIC92_01430 [Clostridiales bacterium]|nr:hypothetical protein [Clostridiales bacterium]